MHLCQLGLGEIIVVASNGVLLHAIFDMVTRRNRSNCGELAVQNLYTADLWGNGGYTTAPEPDDLGLTYLTPYITGPRNHPLP
jgi:hypothetical protein